MRRSSAAKGVLLIICLILLLVLANISMVVLNVAVSNSKASQYTSMSVEAEQKAISIANFVYIMLDKMNKTATSDITPCSMSGSCLVWSSSNVLPSDIMDHKSDIATKQWWYDYSQDYANAKELQALNVPYDSTTADSSDPVAGYIIQEVSTSYSAPWRSRTLKILAYATDLTGRTAAIHELYFLWKILE